MLRAVLSTFQSYLPAGTKSHGLKKTIRYCFLGLWNQAPEGTDGRYTDLPFLAALVQKGADIETVWAR